MYRYTVTNTMLYFCTRFFTGPDKISLEEIDILADTLVQFKRELTSHIQNWNSKYSTHNNILYCVSYNSTQWRRRGGGPGGTSHPPRNPGKISKGWEQPRHQPAVRKISIFIDLYHYDFIDYHLMQILLFMEKFV